MASSKAVRSRPSEGARQLPVHVEEHLTSPGRPSPGRRRRSRSPTKKRAAADAAPAAAATDAASAPDQETQKHLRPLRALNGGTDPLLVPPLNFAKVDPGIYRSGYPNSKNFPFLRRLGLRSIVNLCMEPYLPANTTFAAASGVVVHHLPLQNLEPFAEMEPGMLLRAMRVLLDDAMRPTLIHCHKGNHSTGCIVGCYRKLHQWSLASIFDEYQRFTGPNIRVLDQLVIELFDGQAVLSCADAPPPGSPDGLR